MRKIYFSINGLTLIALISLIKNKFFYAVALSKSIGRIIIFLSILGFSGIGEVGAQCTNIGFNGDKNINALTFCAGTTGTKIDGELAAGTPTYTWEVAFDLITNSYGPVAGTGNAHDYTVDASYYNNPRAYFFRRVITGSSDGACNVASDIVTIIVVAVPGTPVPANNGPLCVGAALNLTTPNVAGAISYNWAGPNGFFASTQNASIGAVTLAAAGSYTVTVNGCTSASASTAVAVNAPPTASNAGPDQTGASTCGLTSVTLAANAPTVGTGAWSIVSGAGGSFANATLNNTTFSGTAGTTYVLRWTISNSPCSPSTDDVSITFNRNPTTSNAGPDQTGASTCGLTSVTLAANAPTVGTGAWSIVSGAGGSFANATLNNTTFSGTAGTTYVLRWTISNSPCSPSTDDVSITFNINPTASNAGPDQTGASTCGLTSVTLAANAPTVGTGAWSIVSGAGGSFANATLNNTTFSGTAGTTYVLRWTISNSPCSPSTDDVSITFNINPTTSNAGPDQTGASTCGLTSVTLAANAPTVGTGAWSIVSGAGGSFANATLNNTTFSGTAGTTYVLRWTISNSPCSPSTDDVSITFNRNPTTSNAGPDQTGASTCGLTSVTLAANAPTVGTGAWSIVSGAGGSFANATLNNTTFSGTAGTTYVLRWTISNSPCSPSTDDVSITFNRNPTTSNAGPDQTGASTCGLTSVTLAANAPTVGTGAWSIVSGAGGSFANATLNNTTFSGTAGTTYVLRWTISNSPCSPSTDDVSITFNRNPTTSNAGPDQTGASTCGLTSVTLAANAPTVGTGAWSIVSGAGGSFANATLNNTTFSGTAGTTYVLRWTISNSPCSPSTDDVSITFNINPTASNAGPDQTGASTCGLTSVTLAANAPTVGTGAWSIVSGAGGSFANATLNNTTFSGTAGTTYVLRWTISNSPCSPSTDDVSITFNRNPTTSNAGPDQTGASTCGLTSVTLAANSPTVGTGAWSIVSGAGGSFANATLNNTTFSGTAGTTYVLRWTISNSPCSPSTDDVSITFNRNPTTSNAGPDQTGASTCGLTSVTLAANSPTVGTGAWSIVSGAGGSFANATLNNTTFSGTAGTIYVLRWTISNAPCSPSTDDVNVTFNIIPTLSSSLTPPARCSNVSTTYTATSATGGATFAWTRNVVAGISNLAGSGNTAAITETLVNTTPDPITVTYAVTVSSNGCSSTQNVQAVVNPTPTLTSSLAPTPNRCSGVSTSYLVTSATAGFTYTWTRPTATNNMTTAAVNTSQVGNLVTGITEALAISTVATAPRTTQYNIILTANGCSNTQSVIITVNNRPTPTVLTGAAQNLCNGDPTTLISFGNNSTVGTIVYNWTNNRPTIGIPLSGTGDITSFTATNATTAPIIANIGVAPVMTYGGVTCSVAASLITVNPITTLTINPTPVLTSTLTPPARCSNVSGTYTATSATVGTTFTWGRAVVAGISNAIGSGSGAAITETLINTTANPVIVVYAITLSANGCSNTQNVPVTVNPSPSLSSSLTPPDRCSNVSGTYIATSATTGTSFTWARAVVAGISNAVGSGSGASITETLINTTAAPVNVVYAITLTASTCSNTQNVTVTVNPTPTLTSGLTPPARCNNVSGTYTATSATTGTTFTWTRAVVGGISNTVGSGSGATITETLINTTTAPVNVVYEITLTANGCSNTQNVTVPVNPTPVLTSSLTPPDRCSNVSSTYTASSATTGTTFAWARSVVAGISNAVGSGSSATITETLINTTTDPVDVVYAITLTANGCSNTQNVTVTVNPSPTLNSSLTPPARCNSASTTYTATSATAGVTYTWGRAVVAGISNAVGSGSGATITESLTNTTTAPLNVVYSITLSANGCSNTQNVTISINPTPVLTSSLTPPGRCSNVSATYSATSATGGVTYSWSRVVVAGISNSAGSGSAAAITETLINTTTDPVNVVYAITLTANGCSNTQNVTVPVNPTPLLTSSLTPPDRCSNVSTTYTATSATAGVTYTWARTVVAGISNAAGSGSSATITETLINTTADPVDVVYAITITANSCSNTQNVTVTVNPTPVLTSGLTPPARCNNVSTTYTASSATAGVTYTWGRAVVAGISNAIGSGSGATITESLINITTAPINVVYAITLSANGCSNTQNVTISINPTPVLTSSLTPPGRCSNVSATYIATSATSGVTYSWSRLVVAGISNPAGSGSAAAITETLINTTTDPVNVVYAITLSANGCSNTQNVTVTVNPSPSLSSSLTPPARCNNVSATYTATSATTGASYTWARAVVAGISNAIGSGNTATITETLINTTTDPINVVYSITLTANGCSNSQNVTVSVNPTPTLTSGLNPAARCSNIAGTYTATSATTGVSYTWIRTVVAGISNVAGSGSSATITETLINTTTTPVNAVYAITLTANGCSNTQNVSVPVNPPPSIANAGPDQPNICGTTPSATLNATLPVVGTGKWTVVSGPDLSSTQFANDAVRNTVFTQSGGLGTYILRWTVSNAPCTDTWDEVSITFNPLLVVDISYNYCITPGKVRLTATPGYTTYQWSKDGNPTPYNTNMIEVDVVGVYSVAVGDAFLCSTTAVAAISVELVTNGSFTAGGCNNGFTSDYTCWPDIGGNNELVPDNGTNGYSVGTNGQNFHPNFWGKDHTNNPIGTRNFMLVNGHGTTLTVWKHATITVLPNTNYYFSAWAMSLNNAGPFAHLQFMINGVLVGTDLQLTGHGESNGAVDNWKRFYGIWNSGAATTANIWIRDLEGAAGGNDFGLDDISFGTMYPLPFTITPKANGNAVATLCEGLPLNLTANLVGGKGPFDYTWTKLSGPAATIVTPDAANTDVTGVVPGNYVFRLSSIDNGYGCTTTILGTTSVTVYPIATITGTLSVCAGLTTSLTGSGTKAASNPWVSSLPGVASVDNFGVVTGVSAGNAVITYTNNNGCTATATVTVNALPTVTGTLSVCAGSTTQLTGSASAAAVNPWVSSVPAVATVDNAGLVTGISAGSSVITYTNTDGCIKTVTITVNAIPAITGGLNICLGSTSLLTGSGGTPVANPWSSATPGVATINAATGLVTSVAAGSSVITYSITNGCSITATVVVNAPPATTGITVCQGGSGVLTSTAPCTVGSGTFTVTKDAGAGANLAGVGTVAWATPGNITSSGAPYATVTLPATQTSNYLLGSGYNFSIPGNAKINGITVVITRHSTGATSPIIQDNRVSLVKAGVIEATNKGVAANWGTPTMPALPATATATYGGVADLWGQTAGYWTPADINNGNFGVVLSAVNPAGGARTATVDYMQISVTYTVPGLDWYTASSGGTLIGSGASFNPVGVAGSPLANTNIAGTTTFYAECAVAPGCRTATDFIINPSPTIAASLTAADRCFSSSAQTSTLTYGAVTNAPSNYTITWDAASLLKGLVNVGSTALPVSPVTFPIAANVAAGTYSGTITVTNAFGCPSTPSTFTGTINAATLGSPSLASDVCSGNTATINLTGLVPNSTSTISYTINGAAQPNAVGVLANAGGAGSFTTVVLNTINNGHILSITSILNTTTGCSQTFVGKNVTLVVKPTGIWLGKNTNWSDVQNWCSAIPDATTDVTVPEFPALGSFMPQLTATSVCKSITLQQNTRLDLNGQDFTVYGAVSLTGTGNGIIKGSATSKLTLDAASANSFINFDQSSDLASNALLNLTVKGGAGNLVTLNNKTAIYGTVSPTAGTLTLAGEMVLRSTATNTARVAEVTGSIAYSGAGKATVERYYIGKRAWRLLTSPLSNTGNIFDTWQNGGVYTVGKGMFVSAPVVTAGNGMDYSFFNNYSMYTWNPLSGGSYVGVPDTKAQILSPGAGPANIVYYAFVRGDRNRTPDNTIFPNTNATTLSSSGRLQTGTQTFNLGAGNYHLVGNPYASSVDFDNITKSANVVPRRFWVHDPNIGSVGVFVVMDDIGNTGTYTGNIATAQNDHIQSSQGFFVQTTGAATVTFNENDKSTNYNPSLFRPVTPLSQRQAFWIGLTQVNANDNAALVDGTLVEFDESFNDTVDIQDALKFINVNENLGLLRQNKLLALERRPLIKATDTMFLQLTRTTQRNYRFDFTPSNLDPTLTAFLEDGFTGQHTPLNLAAKSKFEFNITADPKSALSNRFRVVFMQAAGGPLPVTFNQINAYQKENTIAVEWKVENEININRYEVEKSADGVNFAKVNTTAATGVSQASKTYNWLDVNPLMGNNFYRIRSVSADGKSNYSSTALVKMGNLYSGIRIYPNPVTAGIIGAEFKNMAAGIYRVRLLNNLGQTILSKTINHAPGTSMETIQPDYKLISGIYQLEVTSPAKEVTKVKVIVK